MNRALFLALTVGLVACANNDGRPPMSDSGFMPFDSGVGTDTGTPPPMFIDTGVPMGDSGPEPFDTGMPMVDSGPEPVDAGSDAGTDSGTMGFDSGPPVDGGPCADGCDDGVACTTDTCGPTGTCVFTPMDADNDGFPPIGCQGGTDCDDTRASVHPGAAEICDGLDNNCDGPADNGSGMECIRGTQGNACNTSCGTTGTRSCTDSCTWGACSATEVCNGCDDDGDGTNDNGFTCAVGASANCMTGCGTSGTQQCNASCDGYNACTATEVCNGCDDDANGTPDDTFACVQGQVTPCMVGNCPGTAVCSNSCTLGTCSAGTPPANNSCGAGVTTITASGTYSFATCGATNNFTGTCGGSTGPDVVFRLDLAVQSDVVLETDASTDFDSVLYLRSGASCPGTDVACNDDIGGGNRRSRISQTLAAGTYWVIVDGFNATATGPGALSATITPQTPPNDECDTPTPITLNLGRTTITGSTDAATDSFDSCYNGRDLWYSITLDFPEVVYVTTFGSSFDTGVGITDFACASSADACDDDSTCGGLQSSIIRALGAGTHFIHVDGALTASAGDFVLNIEHLPLGNSNAADFIAAGSSTVDGTTSGTGVLSDCRTGDAPENSYYWTQCPAAAGGSFSLDTCDANTILDTVAYVWSGVTGFTLACNDDDVICPFSGGSYISTTIPSGAGLFMAYVDGYSDDAGAYRAHFVRP